MIYYDYYTSHETKQRPTCRLSLLSILERPAFGKIHSPDLLLRFLFCLGREHCRLEHVLLYLYQSNIKYITSETFI